MNNSIYGILKLSKDHETRLISIGNYSEYKRYSSYFLHRAYVNGYKSKLGFCIYYYSYFYNPDWESLTNKTETLWLSPNVIPLDMNFIYGTNRWNFYPELVLVTLRKTDSNNYTIEHIITPLDIWKNKGLFDSWSSTYKKCSYITSLECFNWKRKVEFDLFSGRKFKYRTDRYSKSHTKHLRAAMYVRNESLKVQKEYGLTCTIKHYKNPRQDYFEDLNRDGYNSYNRKSWKNQKFRHQYDHKLVYKSRHKHRDVELTNSVKHGCEEYYESIIVD